MRLSRTIGGLMALVLAPVLALALPAGPASSGWLSRLAGEAGEAGAKVGSRSAREAAHGLEGVAGHVSKLPPLAKGEAVLAAHVGSEGHWTFVNRAGERFTAATPDELSRVTKVLGAEAGEGGKLRLVLSQDTVFGKPAAIGDLPEGARLEVLADGTRYRVIKEATGDGAMRLSAALKPNVGHLLTSPAAFAEMRQLMARAVGGKALRVISLEPGGPQTLKPRTGDAPGRPLPEPIDPFKLSDAFSALGGQTVLVSGRVEGRFLKFRQASGAEQSLLLSDLRTAAARHDADLVILQSPGAEQPGARNWLYQQVAVSGLDKPAAPATLGDLLEAVAERRGRLVASVEQVEGDRVAAKLAPAEAPSAVSTDTLTRWFDDVVQNVVGNVVTSGIELDVRSQARVTELKSRIVPGIPSDVQFAYVALIVVGLMGIGRARAWWYRVWRPELREEYGSAVGYWAARGVKLVAFLLVFLPIVAIPAFLISVLDQVVGLLFLPVKAGQWVVGRFRRAPG